MAEWIEIDGVRCDVRLTATRIVVTFASSYCYRYSVWRDCGKYEGYFDIAEPRGSYSPSNQARWVGDYYPTRKNVETLRLDLPETWPPCSDKVRDALTKRAERGVQIDKERMNTRIARSNAAEHAQQLANAQRAVIAAAEAGDDVKLVECAARLRVLQQSTESQ